MATAAIEALTKDSILHRKDVKTLLKTHKDKTQQLENEPSGQIKTEHELSQDINKFERKTASDNLGQNYGRMDVSLKNLL